MQKNKEIERLREVFDNNYRLTELYATYLERFPELITKEIVDELCNDGTLKKEDAIAAILSEAFIGEAKDEKSYAFIRKYIYPSVRILDTKSYYENPYYKNINTDNIKSGDWEFKTEVYPPYRAMICDDMILSEDFSEIAPLGFFTEEFRFPAVLESGNEWMTLSPIDVDTCEMAIAAAHGKVITFGLGLGYYAYMVSEKETVESVTIIEKSETVIQLFKEHILPQFENKGKIEIINADAFEYAEHEMPRKNYDYAFVDTWRDAGDGAPMYKRMKGLESLSKGTKFDYWIENFLISRLRAEKFEQLYQKYENGEAIELEHFISELKKPI